jgi:ACR3 family arsenite efflux pump ArsB
VRVKVNGKILLIFGNIGLFIVIAGGLTNPLSYWNCVPILTAYAITKNATKSAGFKRMAGAIGFCLASIGLTVLMHVLWLLDWNKIATGSSTSALVFVFLPVYSLLSGGVGYLIGYFLGRKFDHSGKRPLS